MFIRNSQKVWPTCPECGCRLEIFENSVFVTLKHFDGNLVDKDARGCKCISINDEWTFFNSGSLSHFGYC